MMNKMRRIPPVHELLELCRKESWGELYPREHLAQMVREELNELRAHDSEIPEKEEIVSRIANRIEQISQYSLKRVINASGVIVHTNLGRAPLSQKALAHMNVVAAGYSNLEFDLNEGERGSRDKHLDPLLHQMIGVEASLIVNNNAAALMLVLNSLAEGKEVIVSRGELVEIGGSFRLPDIMKKSGVILREVGATNKTRTSDFRRAINDQTAMILIVHPSNFQMIGFVERPAIADLVALGKQNKIPVVEDQGSGILTDLSKVGIPDEPSVLERLETGLDLITFSGDKILGGPQAGFICGKKIWIDRCRKNPIFRALRVDKMIYAATEATLMTYLQGRSQEIPVIRMISESPENLRNQGNAWLERLQQLFPDDQWTLVVTQNYVGGGVAPMKELLSYAVSLRSRKAAHEIAKLLRHADPPVIARVEEDCVLFELRTITTEEQELITNTLASCL
jgi:L-seryl-tRNA(Ser) seleniumtransferase